MFKETQHTNSIIEGSTINSSKNLLGAKIAEKICNKYFLIFSGGSFYRYSKGCYRVFKEEQIKRIILLEIGDFLTKYKINEIYSFMKIIAYLPEDMLNQSPFLNLKNGLLNIATFELEKHSDGIYSTIQLDVNYKTKSCCPKWIKTLHEIFENDTGKINIIQEFFGLCLTSETKFEKALFLVGEGANGKSVILFILQKLLGNQNYSAVPLEKFGNSHYIAGLFSKLANISIETNAKSEVYDSVFKAVSSGDEIEADHKFGKPFKFAPFCKLIFALNNMPRVDDKTASFFRRLIIIRFNRQFSEKEQNKNLKQELLKELDGIFLWCLEGLKRLQNRGYFELPKSIHTEINEYKKDNNNVLLFIEEVCSFEPNFSITKNELYQEYSFWCPKNGYRAIGKKRFGNELKRHFLKVNEGKSKDGHIWTGLKLTEREQNESIFSN